MVDGDIIRRFTGGGAGDYSVLEQTTNYRYGSSGSGLGLTTSWGTQHFGQGNENINMQYVTGSHAFKTGLSLRQGWSEKFSTINHDVSYTFINRVPNLVTYWATPFRYQHSIRNTALFAEDQWNIKRYTLNVGLRYDAMMGTVPDQHLPAGPWVPARDFAGVKNVPSWKDINPRFGLAHDLRGNGKTAIKAALGRYVNFESAAGIVLQNNPVNQMVTSATRTWNDANGDYVPQDSELGPLSNVNFGKVVANTTYADDVIHGWGVRGYSWQGLVALQHELAPGFAVNVGYFRTWFGNFTVTDNLAVGPSDYDPFCITAPGNAGLPNSGQRVCGLFDIKPEKFGQVQNQVVRASKFGKPKDVFNGVDVTVNARMRQGIILSGGLSTGSEMTDYCFTVDSPGTGFHGLQRHGARIGQLSVPHRAAVVRGHADQDVARVSAPLLLPGERELAEPAADSDDGQLCRQQRGDRAGPRAQRRRVRGTADLHQHDDDRADSAEQLFHGRTKQPDRRAAHAHVPRRPRQRPAGARRVQRPERGFRAGLEYAVRTAVEERTDRAGATAGQVRGTGQFLTSVTTKTRNPRRSRRIFRTRPLRVLRVLRDFVVTKEVSVRRIYLLAIAVAVAATTLHAQQRPAVDNSRAPILQFESVPDPLKLPNGMNFGEVLGVAVNSKGTVVVLNHPGTATSGPLYGNATTNLLEFDSSGKYIGEIGKGVYGLGYAHSVRFDKYDNLWVVDKGTNSAMKFNPGPAWRVVLNLGRRPEGYDSWRYERPTQAEATAGEGTFNGATDVAWDSNDNIYVSDGYVNSRIAKFDKNGNWIKSWGQFGRGGDHANENPGSINNPHNIQIDRKNNVYVADRGNRRIQVFDTDGNFKYFLFLNAPYDKKHHPTLAPVPANPPDETAPWALCITPTADAVPVRRRLRAGAPLQDDARRQDPRHARHLGPRDGAVQLAARPRLPEREHGLRRRHEQLARAEDPDQGRRLRLRGSNPAGIKGIRYQVSGRSRCQA